MSHLGTGRCVGASNAARARDGTARRCTCALALTLSLSSPALAETQTTAAGPGAWRTLTREPTMTQLDTVDAPTATYPSREAAGHDAIRPFRAHISEADVADMRRRLAATRWPDKETVGDASQGVQLANLRELVRYWATDYDWRKGEAKLNSFPQFMTTIDGVNIHFIHVKSRHPNAMPLIAAHGWPGSVFEQIKLIEPLTDPTKYGGRAEDAFDVVIYRPAAPGHCDRACVPVVSAAGIAASARAGQPRRLNIC